MIRSRISPATARVRCLTARSADTTAWAAFRSSASVASSPNSGPRDCSTPLDRFTATGPSSHPFVLPSGPSSAGPVRVAVVDSSPNGCGRSAVTPAATPNPNSAPPASLTVTPASRPGPSGSDRRSARENPRPAAVIATPIWLLRTASCRCCRVVSRAIASRTSCSRPGPPAADCAGPRTATSASTMATAATVRRHAPLFRTVTE